MAIDNFDPVTGQLLCWGPLVFCPLRFLRGTGLCDWPHVGKSCTQLTLYLRSRSGGLTPFLSQPIRLGLRIYEMRGNHWKKDALVCGPGHCSLLRVGWLGGGGPATLGMDGERKKSEQPGSGVFLGAGKKTEQVALQVGSQSPPHGSGRSRNIASACRPHSSTRADLYDCRL